MGRYGPGLGHLVFAVIVIAFALVIVFIRSVIGGIAEAATRLRTAWLLRRYRKRAGKRGLEWPNQ